jgi:hypothetical protein
MRSAVVPGRHIVQHGAHATSGAFQVAEAVCLVVLGVLLVWSLFHIANNNS